MLSIQIRMFLFSAFSFITFVVLAHAQQLNRDLHERARADRYRRVSRVSRNGCNLRSWCASLLAGPPMQLVRFPCLHALCFQRVFSFLNLLRIVLRRWFDAPLPHNSPLLCFMVSFLYRRCSETHVCVVTLERARAGKSCFPRAVLCQLRFTHDD